jgi:hypothetical protein
VTTVMLLLHSEVHGRSDVEGPERRVRSGGVVVRWVTLCSSICMRLSDV